MPQPLSALLLLTSLAPNGTASRLDSAHACVELRVEIAPSVMMRDDGSMVGADVDLAKRVVDSLGGHSS